MAKTQVLNTVFKGDASGLTSEIGRLTNTVSSTLSGVYSRAMALQNVSGTSGLKTRHVAALSRMEETLGIPGLAEAITQITRKKTFKQDAGIRSGLRMLGIDEKEFYSVAPPNQAELLGRKLNEMKDPRKRMIAASMLGARDPMLMLGEQAGRPGGMQMIEEARKAASRHADDQQVLDAQARYQQLKKMAKGEVADTFKDVLGGKYSKQIMDELPWGGLQKRAEEPVKIASKYAKFGKQVKSITEPFGSAIDEPSFPFKGPDDTMLRMLNELEKLNKIMGP
jgi:hypothetical protein